MPTASIPVPYAARSRGGTQPQPEGFSPETGAIRTTGTDPQTAPIILHPGDSMSLARRVVTVVLLGALTALGPFTVDLYLPAFPMMEEYFNTSAAAIQLTLTGTMIGFGIGQLVVGPLSDVFGRRVPLLLTTGLHLLASVAAALAPTLPLLGLTRVLMGIGAAGGAVVAMAVVRDLFGGRRLVVMLSRLALVTGVAPVIAPLIGSALVSVIPWQGLFVVLAIYGAVMLASGFFLIPETLPAARRGAPGSSTVWQRYRTVLSDRVYLGVLVIGAMTFSGLFSYLSASSFLFQTGYGFSEFEYGLLFAVNSVGIVTGTQISARLATRIGPQWVLAGSTTALLVFGTAIAVCDAAGLGMWGVMIPLFLFITACGFTLPCAQVLALDRHGNAAGTAASLLGAMNFGVAGLISPLVGLISGGSGISGVSMAAVMIGCAVIGIVSLWAVVRPRSVGMLSP